MFRSLGLATREAGDHPKCRYSLLWSDQRAKRPLINQVRSGWRYSTSANPRMGTRRQKQAAQGYHTIPTSFPIPAASLRLFVRTSLHSTEGYAREVLLSTASRSPHAAKPQENLGKAKLEIAGIPDCRRPCVVCGVACLPPFGRFISGRRLPKKTSRVLPKRLALLQLLMSDAAIPFPQYAAPAGAPCFAP